MHLNGQWQVREVARSGGRERVKRDTGMDTGGQAERHVGTERGGQTGMQGGRRQAVRQAWSE